MITGFENQHNMFCLDRPMAVQTVPQGVILPRKEVENGPRWGLGGVCTEHNAFVELSAYDGGWATHGGGYATENEAAAAYNRAAMLLNDQGVTKNFPINYIEGISDIEYANLLMKVRISSKIRHFNK